MNNSNFGKGVFFSSLAFVMWGVLPLYWKLLAAIRPLHLLGFRIIISLLFVGAILLAAKNFKWVKAFGERKKSVMVILCGLTVSANWGIYIWAVNSGHTIDASLGYYINPLVSIVLGLVFLKEKLISLQWLAFGVAALGVIILTVLSGSMPWVSLGIALTFGAYGLLKKTVDLSSLESLGAETLAAIPIAFLLFFFSGDSGDMFRLVKPQENISYLAAIYPGTWISLAFIGLVSALPLYFFTFGAKMLPLSTLGFVQFISPTFQFIMGFFVFHEYFPKQYFVAFAFIWLAVIIYIVSLNIKREKPEPLK